MTQMKHADKTKNVNKLAWQTADELGVTWDFSACNSVREKRCSPSICCEETKHKTQIEM